MATGGYNPFGGGGSGTVHVTAPVTGDGSIGSPIAVSAASGGAAGTMAAADFTKLSGVVPSLAWAKTAYDRAQAISGTLTGWHLLRFGVSLQQTVGTLALSTGTIEGGSFKGTTFIQVTNGAILQTPQSALWFVQWRGKMQAPSGTQIGDIGLTNAAGSTFARIRCPAVATGSKFRLETSVASFASDTTATADGALHDFALANNGTNLLVFVDGVQVLSTANTNMPSDAQFCYLSGNNSGFADVSRVFYAFVEA